MDPENFDDVSHTERFSSDEINSIMEEFTMVNADARADEMDSVLEDFYVIETEPREGSSALPVVAPKSPAGPVAKSNSDALNIS